jgi:hypothetical protein
MGVRDLIIYQKMYDAALYGLPILNRMPRSYRPTMVREIQAIIVRLLAGIVAANHDPVRRLDLLRTMDTDLEVLRSLLRLSHDLKLLATKQYGVLSGYLDEVGRLLGGWLSRSVSGPGGTRPRRSAAATGTMPRTRESLRST